MPPIALTENIRGLDEAAAHDLLSAFNLSNTCIRTMDGTILFWCDGNINLYGYARDEAIGRVTHSLLQTKFPVPLYQIEVELLQAGSWKGELLHRSKSGSPVWVASHWVLQRDASGTPRSVIEVNNDVTERHRADETSRYLASLVESSDDAIISKNLNGMVTSWNSGAQRLFGYTDAEMLGKTILKLFPPELVQEEAAILSRIEQGERISHYETTRLAKSGRRIPVSLTVSPIYGEAGRIIGASKIARDISERKDLEAAVAASEQRQRLAVEAGEVGLWSYDIDAGESHWSDRCKAIFGLDPSEPAPGYEASLHLVHPEDVERVDRAFQASVFEASPFDLDFRLVDRTGAEHWVHSKARPYTSADGRVTQVHGVIVDFTARKRNEEDLKRVNDQLRQFAYAAAHDLQEPLRNVALSIELAKAEMNSQLDAEASFLLTSAVENAQRMQAMVRDLLAYSKVLHEIGESAAEVVDACQVFDTARANLETAIREEAAEVTSGNLPAVKIARIHLLQLFQNLIGNGLKHRSSEPPRIHVDASMSHSRCQFSVSDNGVGIEPEFQERVFDVFRRLRKREAPGTGMGLALCKRIVERYDGRIWIDSDGKNGTTVSFTLPRADAS